MRVALISSLVILGVGSAGAQGSPSASQEIRKQVATLQAAFNKQDAAGVVAVYAPDGDAMVNDGPYASGTAGLTKAARDQFASNPKGLQIAITVTEVRFLTPDVAVASTRAHFNLPDVKDDRGTFVFVRRDGKWLLGSLRVQAAQKQ